MAGLEDDFFGADESPAPDDAANAPETVKEPESPAQEGATSPETPEAADASADDAGEADETPVSQGRLNAILAEREKRQAAEARAADLERRLAEAQQSAQAQPQQKPAPRPRPDPVMDPDGFNDWIEERLYLQREASSQAIAVGAHGLEAVAAAERALNAAVMSDPGLAQTVRNHPDPYGFAVAWHKRQALQSELAGVSSMDELIEREAAKRGYIRAGSGQPVIAPARVVGPDTTLPPRSLASAAASPANPAAVDKTPDAFERKLFGPK